VRYREWRVDLCLMAIAAALGAFFYVDWLSTEADPARDGRVWIAGVGVVACLSLPLRRRWPVLLALSLIPLMLVSSAAFGATAAAMMGVAIARPRWVTATLLALHATVVTIVYGLLAEAPDFWQGVMVVLTLDVAMIASGLLMRSRRLLVESSLARAREAEEAQWLRLEDARHNERERIAREMHDVLAHRISLLAVHAGALQVRRSAPEEERRAAEVIRQYAYQALEDLREVIGVLRANPTADADRPQPSLADLPALVEQSRLAGTRITLDCPDLPAAPDTVGRHAYRVVQEGLTNAHKHAPGRPVRVRVIAPRSADTGLEVEVVNTLAAPAGPEQLADRIPGAGSGLVGLRERMDLIGGRLEHGETPDGEFRLHAWLPWRR
jgi:signal transduction histidine kinase